MADVINIRTKFWQKTHHQVESLLSLKNTSCCCASKSHGEIVIQLLYGKSVKGNPVSSVLYTHLRQSRCLFNDNIGCSGYVCY